MIKFILNNNEVLTKEPSGMPLLEFIRYHRHLTGTKTGCNEGDCGACTVLVGDLVDGNLRYRSFTSCLTPLANVHGKHVVTVEGLTLDAAVGSTGAETLNPVQQVMYEESATQCGFCTPGFVVSLAGFCLSDKAPTAQNAIAAVDGNICRCTGYKSIQRAACRVAGLMEDKTGDSLHYLITEKMLPAYFHDIKERLQVLRASLNGELKATIGKWFVGGGTDLYVQKHEEIKEAAIHVIVSTQEMVKKEGDIFIISSSATVTDIKESAIMQAHFPNLHKHLRLVSSTQIRNMATIAGNFVNASPIGDLTIFFLVLDAKLVLAEGDLKREIPLRSFYKGYKDLDKLPNEYIESVCFAHPPPNSFFNFEKVSKRTHLDIASVNSAMLITMQDDIIVSAGISAGGVGPVPKYLEKTSTFLQGKNISQGNMAVALAIAQTEIQPISDARGTEEYKRLLLNQLIKAHFIELFPAIVADWIME